MLEVKRKGGQKMRMRKILLFGFKTIDRGSKLIKQKFEIMLVHSCIREID
jgi:hypothetical protein